MIVSQTAFTPAQLDAIAEQARAYDSPETECIGLQSYRVIPGGSDETWGDAGEPGEAVAIFHYLAEEPHRDPSIPGLEITVYDRDGNVRDSQDFG